MVVNLPLSLVPRAVTEVMITTAIKPAMRPYSMAVAPGLVVQKTRKQAHALLLFPNRP
jgi:hypothetical protein